MDEAIDECRKAIRLKEDFPGAHEGLGLALAEKGRSDEEIAQELTELGYRSPKGSVVVAATVQSIRLKQRIFAVRQPIPPRQVSGKLTLPQI